MTLFRHLLVPTDFGAASRHAADVAADLAQRFGASLTLLHINDLGSMAFATIGAGPEFATVDVASSLEDASRIGLDRELARVRHRMPNALGILRTGSPCQEILATAEEAGADLIVMGTHGRRGLEHLVMGSIAEKVVQLSSVAVLTVHAPVGAVEALEDEESAVQQAH